MDLSDSLARMVVLLLWVEVGWEIRISFVSTNSFRELNLEIDILLDLFGQILVSIEF